nr:hypothetical protein KitaXyl93_14940 [Kitasatospora sp. Xyl93]
MNVRSTGSAPTRASTSEIAATDSGPSWMLVSIRTSANWPYDSTRWTTRSTWAVPGTTMLTETFTPLETAARMVCSAARIFASARPAVLKRSDWTTWSSSAVVPNTETLTRLRPAAEHSGMTCRPRSPLLVIPTLNPMPESAATSAGTSVCSVGSPPVRWTSSAPNALATVRTARRKAMSGSILAARKPTPFVSL